MSKESAVLEQTVDSLQKILIFFSSYLTQEDLSRFGREHLLCGHYTEIVYPTLGVNFIAIQENVDTTKGMGTEMMPFHNIFQ